MRRGSPAAMARAWSSGGERRSGESCPRPPSITHHMRAPGEGLGVRALLAHGWPGERVLVEAAETRVRVAISTLRSMGLRT